MTTAPYCNVSVTEPPGDPKQPTGFQKAQPGMTLDQLANLINNNFQLLAKGNFVEDKAKRVTRTVRIFDPAKSGAYIDVEQISAVTLRNPQTGQTVIWQR